MCVGAVEREGQSGWWINALPPRAFFNFFSKKRGKGLAYVCFAFVMLGWVGLRGAAMKIARVFRTRDSCTGVRDSVWILG